MADIGDEFVEFLKAQFPGVLSELNSDKVDDITVTRTFEKYKSIFEAWLKIPLKYKPFGRADGKMLEAAQKDPIFTENDAKRVDEEIKRESMPYEIAPKSWHDTPIFDDLIAYGIKMTPAHVAKQKLNADHLRRGGYSYHTAEKLAFEFVAVSLLVQKRNEILMQKNLSQDEKKKQLSELDEKINQRRKERLDTAKDDCLQNQPERLLMLMLRDFHRGKISKEEAVIKTDFYIKQIIRLDRVYALNEAMEKSLYQKVLNEESKDVLRRVMDANRESINPEMTKNPIISERPKATIVKQNFSYHTR